MIAEEILNNLEVKHTRDNPVFVIGHARSGTSITIKMIRKYLKVNFGTESQFIIRFYSQLSHYNNLQKTENIKALIEEIAKERCFKRWNVRFQFELDTKKVYDELPERSYRGVLISIFKQFADYHGMTRWGDKTPEYIVNLPLLFELFPNAQFIHVVRDGRDVALSNFLTPFGEKNCVSAALDWQHKIKLARQFGHSLGKDQYTEIRYEDLLNKPIEVFAHLIDFLAIDDSDGKLLSFISEHIGDDLNRGNFYKWKSGLSEQQRRRFEKVAGKELRLYNYETEFSEMARITPWGKWYWHLDNFIRKHANLGYWKDNFYKLKLKTKSMLRRLYV